MLSDNDIKEELSYAYVHAVAAHAGFSCERISKDRDSIDVMICAKGRLAEDSLVMSPKLDLQLKATASREIDDENRLVIDLKMKNYDELRQISQTPRVLVVMALPEEKEKWLAIEPEKLITRRCCYWHTLVGAPAVDNLASRRVKVSTAQVFSPENLRTLLNKASRFEEINNDL